MVFVSIRKNASDEAREKAANKMEEIVVEANTLPSETLHFGSVARRHSDDSSSRYRGGVMGWLVDHPSRSYKWEDEVVRAAFELQSPGEISPVVKAERGLYLLRLVQEVQAEIQPLDELRDGLHNRLVMEARREEKERVLDDVRGDMDVLVNESVLAAIKPISVDKKITGIPRPPAMP